MKRKFRLTRSSDFKRVRRFGKSYAHPLVVLITSPVPDPVLRIGVAAGRTVGKAVERNRAKRLIRTGLSELLPEISRGWELIFLARQPLVKASYSDTCAALRSLLKRAKLVSGTDENDRQ